MWPLAAQLNSFRNAVTFKAAVSQIPEGAIVLEVGPHAVLRALVRQNRWAGLHLMSHSRKRWFAT